VSWLWHPTMLNRRVLHLIYSGVLKIGLVCFRTFSGSRLRLRRSLKNCGDLPKQPISITLPVFKERLFVHLSRFCAVRYCVARHTGFLIGLGRPAGDKDARAESIVDVVKLLRRPLPRGPELESRLSFYSKCPAPLVEMPTANTQMEEGLFSLASHVFLQTADAPKCLDALERLLGTVRLQYQQLHRSDEITRLQRTFLLEEIDRAERQRRSARGRLLAERCGKHEAENLGEARSPRAIRATEGKGAERFQS
jgi:hypothetical protein